jgi:hypothetical protein
MGWGGGGGGGGGKVEGIGQEVRVACSYSTRRHENGSLADTT